MDLIKKFLNGLPLYFILFFPSLIFYTSLGLRDPLVLIFMILGNIFNREKIFNCDIGDNSIIFHQISKFLLLILFIYSLSIVFDIKKYQILFFIINNSINFFNHI